MAHFAELNESGVVTRVVVVNNKELLRGGVEDEGAGVEFLQMLYGHSRWKQTSYSASIRKNYAGVGYRYDNARDAFVPPRPFPSWVLDADSCAWRPPVSRPQDGKPYKWDEELTAWVLMPAAGLP